MVTAAAVIADLLALPGNDNYTRALQAAVNLRAAFLITDAVLVACYFHPGVHRASLPQLAKDKMFQIVRSTFKNIAGDPVLAEWQRCKIEPPRTIETNVKVTTVDYTIYWSKTAFEHLAGAIVRVIEGNPTEAECERAFSSIKWAFPRLRTSSMPDLVKWTCQGASAIALLRNFEFGTESEEPKAKCNPEDVDEVPTTIGFTAQQAIILIEKWVDCNRLQPDVGPSRRRGRVENQLCGECNGAHEDSPTRWVKCTTCATWYAFECIGIADEDHVLIEQSVTWNCQDCVTHHRVA